jgi:hypothetical protein
MDNGWGKGSTAQAGPSAKRRFGFDYGVLRSAGLDHSKSLMAIW